MSTSSVARSMAFADVGIICTLCGLGLVVAGAIGVVVASPIVGGILIIIGVLCLIAAVVCFNRAATYFPEGADSMREAIEMSGPVDSDPGEISDDD